MLSSLPISQFIHHKTMLIALVSFCVCRIANANTKIPVIPHFRGKTEDFNKNDAGYSSISRSLESEKSNTFTIVIATLCIVLVISVLLLLVSCIKMSTKLQLEKSTKKSESGDAGSIGLSSSNEEKNHDPKNQKDLPSSVKKNLCDQTIADASVYTTGNEVEGDRNIRTTKLPISSKTPVYEQTITDDSIYTTDNNHETNLSIYDFEADINTNTEIRIDGVSVLSYLESAHNAHDELSPDEIIQQMEEYNHYHDRPMISRLNVVDGKSESAIDPSLISAYSMDQFYPDDDDVITYNTTTRTSESFANKNMVYDMSLYQVEDGDSMIS